MTLNYLAYGSNLHPVRLRQRAPSARLVGTVEMPGRAVKFWKRGMDGSGKCTIGTGRPGDIAYGAVFSIAGAEKPALDRAEGLGSGYRERREELAVGGRLLPVFFYTAMPAFVDEQLQPYHWYLDLVLAGARHHRFPAQYIDALEVLASAKDPDLVRCEKHRHLVQCCITADHARFGL